MSGANSYFKGLEFIACGRNERCRGYIDRRFDVYYGIQYNHSGPLRYSIDGSRLKEVFGPHVIITYPGPHFVYGSPPNMVRHHNYLCFNGPRAESYIRSGLLPVKSKVPVIKIFRPNVFFAGMREIMSLLKNDPKPRYRAVHLLEGLLLEMLESREFKSSDISRNAGVEDLIREVQNRPQLDWDFHAEAKRLGLSYPHFRRLFQELCASPPARFTQNLRLNLAARMLVESNETVAEIADNVAIRDVYHFSKLFKKRFQIPPGKYRREFF